MSAFLNQVQLTFKWAIKDRVFYAVIGVSVGMLLLIPALSSFSMRQVQELSITLSLSLISLMLVVMAVLLGTSALWREIEKRYIISVLSLPISRSAYLLGKFTGVVLILVACAMILGLIASLLVLIASSTYPAQNPILWFNFVAAIFFELLKSIIVAAVALAFTSVATTFYLPFFGAFGIYIAGNASQEVYDYISSEYGDSFPTLAKAITEFFYYVIPNFSAFDLKVYAIYSLPLPAKGLLLTITYFLLYSSVLVGIALFCFNRRQRI
ncbi:MAG: hypothetical protein C0623_00680 [Desulfuromonas sp.]|nr:MAG: hypothetical protein C0623_00680 [Desulfuromonas sp.]